jgi:hypothetical protein
MKKQQQDEPYCDTFVGRGQELQDEHDQNNGLLEGQTPPKSNSDLLSPEKKTFAERNPPPTRDKFKTQEDFEEAMGYWQSNVGRILGLVKQAQASKDSPPASK